MNTEEEKHVQSRSVDEEEEPRKERPWLWPVLCGLLFSFTLCVFAPIELYFSNASELWFSLSDIAPGVALAFALVWLLISGLCLLLRGRARSVVCALVFGLAVLLYAQGNFLNPVYGVLDGTAIDWSEYGDYALWNTALWMLAPAACIALALWKRKGFPKASGFICAVLTLMQLVTLVTLLATPAEDGESGGVCFTKEDEFTLSADKNIVVFLLDTVDTSTVEDTLAWNERFFEPLDGFVMFPNSVSEYPVTKYALPYVLTGEPSLLEETYGNYLVHSWERETFFHTLHDNGYDIYLYTESEFAQNSMRGIVRNVADEQFAASDPLTLWGMMYKFAGFRYAPHLLKPSLWFYSGDFNSLRVLKEGSVYPEDDAVFLADLKAESVSCTGEAPRLTLYHLAGAHVPHNLRADGTRAESVSVDEQVGAVFGGVFSILEQMKAQGVYDDATIIITADHGNIVLDQSPVLLIKRPGATGALTRNSVLAFQSDLHQTLLTAAGIDADLGYGEDLFSLEEGEYRESVRYNFRWVDLTVLYEYAVFTDETGKALHVRTGTEYKTDGAYEIETPLVAFGETVPTRSVKELAPYVDEICKYYQSDGNGCVTLNDPWQRFQWQLPEDAEYDGVRVAFTLAGITGESQRVEVLADDGTLLETVEVRAGDEALSFALPFDAIDNGLVGFTLRFPDASSVYERTNGEDYSSYERTAIAISGFVCEAE